VTTNIRAAADAWGDALPDWVRVLAEACDITSQAVVAKRLGISPAVVNQTLRGLYKGDVARFAERVRGELLRETVECPVLGDTTKRICLDIQVQPWSCTNFVRTQLYHACRAGCTHYRGVTQK
jgi:hypothetical protein